MSPETSYHYRMKTTTVIFARFGSLRSLLIRKAMLSRMVIGLGLEVAAVSSPAAEFDQTHQLLDQVLHQYVKDARVDYKALKASPEELNRYLDQLAALSKAEFKQWNERQQLAFLINTYNATTLKLIADH